MEISKIHNNIPGRGKHLEDGVAWSNGFSNSHENREKSNLRRRKISTVQFAEHNFYSFSVAVNTSSSVIAGNNDNRRYLLIQNVGQETSFLGFSSLASLTGSNSIELNPGFQIEFDTIVPNNVINAICASSTTLVILEGRIR